MSSPRHLKTPTPVVLPGSINKVNKVFKCELINSIQFSGPGGHEALIRGVPPGSNPGHPYETQAWKLRRALVAKEEEAMARKAGSPGGGGSMGARYYGDPVPTISPLDYVKNRIAEVSFVK